MIGIERKLKDIKKHLEKAGYESAVKALSQLPKKAIDTQEQNLYKIKERYKEIKQKYEKREISQERYHNALKAIEYDILIIIDELEGKIKKSAKGGMGNRRAYPLVFLISIFFLAILFYVLHKNQSLSPVKVVVQNSANLTQRDSIYKVLIFPFVSTINSISKQGGNENKIHHLIASALEGLKNVEVEVVDTLDSYLSFQKADSIGSNKKMDLVLWGEAAYIDAVADSIFLNLKYQSIEQEKYYTQLSYLANGQTEMKPYGYVDLVKSGQLTLKVYDVINWTLGSQAFKERKWETAIKHFEDIINSKNNEKNFSKNDRETIYAKLANCYIAMNRPTQARIYLFDVIAMSSETSPILNNLATTYLLEKNLDSAFYYVSKSILLNPNDANSYNNRSHIYSKKGEHELALKDINEAIRLSPDFILYYGNKASILSQMGKHEESLDNYMNGINCARKFDGNNYIISTYYSLRAKVYINLYFLEKQGVRQLSRKNFDLSLLTKANIELKEAAKAERQEQYFSALGYFHFVQKDFKNAIRYYSIANAIFEIKKYNNPDRAEVLNTMGVSYMQLNQFDKAVNSFSTALGIEPRPEIYKNRADAYFGLGRKADAEEDLRKVSQFNVQNSRIPKTR